MDDLIFVNFVYDTIFLGGNNAGLPAIIDTVAHGETTRPWLSDGSAEAPEATDHQALRRVLGAHSKRCMYVGA